MTSEAGWYPVALAAGLEPGTSAGTRLFGRELVVWRDAAGASHVWEDRCPHRGMRLSFGFVRGDRLACLYHGWQFDAAGRCRFIPAHPNLDVPETIEVTRFTSAERLGIVWVHVGPPDAADPPPGDNAATTAVRAITIDAPDATVVSALRREPPPFDETPSAGFVRTGPLLRLDAGGSRLVLAVQPLAAAETCLHIVLAGADGGGDRPRVSRWAQAVRRRAEIDSRT